MRRGFHDDIDQLSARLIENATLCDRMLEQAVTALVHGEQQRAERIAALDGEVDDNFAAIEHELIGLFALQAPVASDLRRLLAIQHINLHIERMGDYATHVARTTGRVAHLPTDPVVTDLLTQMGTAAVAVSQAALEAFRCADAAAARDTATLDDRVDQLNLAIFKHLVELGPSSPQRLEWGTHLVVVARSIERYGDHAVDIAEQTIFAVTGATVELSSNDPYPPDRRLAHPTTTNPSLDGPHAAR